MFKVIYIFRVGGATTHHRKKKNTYRLVCTSTLWGANYVKGLSTLATEIEEKTQDGFGFRQKISEKDRGRKSIFFLNWGFQQNKDWIISSWGTKKRLGMLLHPSPIISHFSKVLLGGFCVFPAEWWRFIVLEKDMVFGQPKKTRPRTKPLESWICWFFWEFFPEIFLWRLFEGHLITGSLVSRFFGEVVEEEVNSQGI